MKIRINPYAVFLFIVGILAIHFHFSLKQPEPHEFFLMWDTILRWGSAAIAVAFIGLGLVVTFVKRR